MVSALPDFEKRVSHKQALLTLLSDGRWHTMRQMQEAGGYRYGGRLHELRKAGHKIDTRNVFGDVFEYRLDLTPGQLELL